MVNNHSRMMTRIVGVAVTVLLLATRTQSLGSVVNYGTTREQQTAFDPALEGFYASATSLFYGEDDGINCSLTHLWGRYYAVAKHEVDRGQTVGQIYLGNDYVNNPGPPIGIISVDVSPDSDLAIITASTADDSPRDPNSKLVGLAVAGQWNSDVGVRDPNGRTIINYFASPLNLQFINQVTGTNITMNDILSGNSIFAVPQVGMLIRGKGFGVWGTFGGSLNSPDGMAGEWWSSVDSDEPNVIFGGYVYTGINYFLAKRTFDPLGGLAAGVDSGSPVITIVTDPAFRILRLTVTNGSATLLWESQIGKTYRVQSVDSLTGAWQNLGNPITATNNATSYMDTPPMEAIKRLYRVVKQ